MRRGPMIAVAARMIQSQIFAYVAPAARLLAPLSLVFVVLAACASDGGGSGGSAGGSGGSGAGLPQCAAPTRLCAEAWLGEAYLVEQFPLDVVGTVGEIVPFTGTPPCVYQTARVIEAGTGKVWQVNFESDGTWPSIAVGDPLEIMYQSDPGDSEGDAGYAQFTVTRAGELVAYDAWTGGDPLDLPGDIALQDGEALCHGTGDFCDFVDHALDVASGGLRVSMGDGEIATVGNYWIALRSNTSLIDTGGCDAGGFWRSLVVRPAQ